ncbi:MAG: hypothetical protein ABL916_19390 [Burkholderiaceae bacterium]
MNTDALDVLPNEALFALRAKPSVSRSFTDGASATLGFSLLLGVDSFLDDVRRGEALPITALWKRKLKVSDFGQPTATTSIRSRATQLSEIAP